MRSCWLLYFELSSFLESMIEQQQLTSRLANMQRKPIKESDAPATVGFLHVSRSENHAALEAKVQVVSPQRSPNSVAASLP